MTLAGWIHLLLFGIVVPIAVIRSKVRVDAGDPLPPLRGHLTATMITLLIFGAVSVIVAWLEGIPLFPRRSPSGAAWMAGAAFVGVTVVAMRPRWRRAVVERQRIVALFAPRDAGERRLWISASILAGLSEEITWRGVQFSLLGSLTGDPLVAAVLSAVMFGAAHLVQGHRTAWVIVGYALAAQALVWLAGSLYVAMAVHATYDAIAGLTYGRFATSLGYFDDDTRVPAPAPLTATAFPPAEAADPESRS